MKKICCMFLACVMVLTGLSIPTFAVHEYNEIGKLSIEEVSILERKLNEVFNAMMDGEEEYLGCRGKLLDGICYGNLLANYYEAIGNKRKSKKCLGKAYALAGEMMWCSVNKSLEPFALELYFFQKAVDCVKGSADGKLRSNLKNRLDYIDTKISDFIEESKLYKDSDKEKTYNQVPKNERELSNLLESANEIFENLDDFFEYSELMIKEDYEDEFALFDLECDSTEEPYNPVDKCICSLKVDGGTVLYAIRNVIKDILKGNFCFCAQNVHIALGLFKQF